MLFAGETGHIGVFKDIGGVFVVAGVGDVQSDFVQSACPAEVLLPLGKVLDGYVFGVAQAVHKGLRGFGDAFGLVEADMIAVLELGGFLSVVGLFYLIKDFTDGIFSIRNLIVLALIIVGNCFLIFDYREKTKKR